MSLSDLAAMDERLPELHLVDPNGRGAGRDLHVDAAGFAESLRLLLDSR
jgi:hypothetical protein